MKNENNILSDNLMEIYTKDVETLKEKYPETWGETTELLRLIDDLGFGSYKLSGNQENPIFVKYSIF